MGAPAWGSRGNGDRPRLLRMTPLRHSFAAPASPPAHPPRTHDYASDADTNKKGYFHHYHQPFNVSTIGTHSGLWAREN